MILQEDCGGWLGHGFNFGDRAKSRDRNKGGQAPPTGVLEDALSSPAGGEVRW
jgi:hypothetical protein